MSRLALEWTQNNFQLPKKISSSTFEHDFSNGFLFLYMLHQKGLASEEILESVSDGIDPTTVLQNFSILVPIARKLGISIPKKDVAKIISEEPGSAAKVVLSLKTVLEASDTSQNFRSNTPAYKKATKSLRPRISEKHESVGFQLDPEEKCIKDIYKSGDGSFRAIDMAVHLRKFQRSRYEADDNILEAEKSEHQKSMDHHRRIRNTTLDKLKSTITHRITKEVEGKDAHRKNQEDKRTRQMRDLQFELAMSKKDTLLRSKMRILHANDQRQGIDGFEHNLLSQGVGGDDSNPNDLTVNYEDPDAYLDRLTDTVRSEWPSDAETRDFILGLKMRAREARLARADKARGRRRMMFEQSNLETSISISRYSPQEDNTFDTNHPDDSRRHGRSSGNNNPSKSNQKSATMFSVPGVAEAVSDSGSDSESDWVFPGNSRARTGNSAIASSSLQGLGSSGASLDRSQTNSALAVTFAKERERIYDAAEEAIRVFAESFRMKSDETEEERKRALHAVLQMRQNKQELKRINATELCHGLVFELIEEVLDHFGDTGSVIGGESLSNQTVESYDSYISLARNRIDADRDAPDNTPDPIFAAITKLDMWPCIFALSRNLGKWYFPSSSQTQTTTRRSSESKAMSGDGSDCVQRDVIPLVRVSCMDSARLCLETVLAGDLDQIYQLHPPLSNQGSHNTSVKASAPLPCRTPQLKLRTEEILSILTSEAKDKGRVILVLGNGLDPETAGFDLPELTWQHLASVLDMDFSASGKVGQSLKLVCLWDFRKSLDVVGRLKTGLATAKKGLDWQILLNSFGFNSHSAAELFTGQELPPLASKVTTELVDYYGKVHSIEALMAKGQEVYSDEIPFTDVTLYSILGSVLYLRNLIRTTWNNGPLASKCPLSPIVITGRITSSYPANAKLPSATVSLGRAFDWFLRGGCRDNIPDTEPDVADLFREEAEQEKISIATAVAAAAAASGKKVKNAGGGGGHASKPSKASKSKDKGDSGGMAKSPISAVLWVQASTGGFEVSSSDYSNLPKEVKFGAEEKVLHAYYQRKPRVEGQTLQSRPSRSSDGMDGRKELHKWSENLGGLPVYFLQLSSKEILGNETENPNESLPLPDKGIQELAQIKAISCLGAVESIIALILDLCGVYRNSCNQSDLPVPPPEPVAVVAPEETKPAKSREKVKSASKEEVITSATLYEPVSDIIDKAFRRLVTIKKHRRKQLSVAELVDLQHRVGEKQLHQPTLITVLTHHAGLRYVECEVHSLLLMGTFLRMDSFQNKLHESKASLVATLKSTDLRMKTHCLRLQQKLTSMPFQADGAALTPAQIKGEADNLICVLGDIIDERHVGWLRYISDQTSQMSLEVSDMMELIIEVSALLSKSVSNTLKKYMSLAAELGSLLMAGGYEECPWALPLSTSRGARMNIDRRRDDLRAMAARLSEAFISSFPPDNSPRSHSNTVNHPRSYVDAQEQPWRELASIEIPSKQGVETDNLSSGLITEVIYEYLDLAVTITTALYAISLEIVSTSEDHIRALQNMTKQRYDYEHEVLKMWAVDLRRACNSGNKPAGSTTFSKPKLDRQSSTWSNNSHTPNRQSPIPPSEAQIFLGKFYFGLSGDSRLDQVEWIHHGTVVDLKDMKLSMESVAVLGRELYISVMMRPNSCFSPREFSEILTGTIQKLVDQKRDLPVSWRHPKKISDFVLSIAPDGDLSNMEFCRRLVMTLVLGNNACAPASDYIVRIGNVFATAADSLTDRNFHFSGQVRPRLEAFLQKSMADSHLSLGWWQGPNVTKINDSESGIVRSALEALVSVCLDAFGGVIIDELMLLLCKSPNMLTSSLFERLLLLAPTSMDVEQLQHDEFTNFLPRFLNDASSKLCAVANRVHTGAAEVSLDQVLSRANARPLLGLIPTVGISVSYDQLKWYLAQQSIPEPSKSQENQEDVGIDALWQPEYLNKEFLVVSSQTKALLGIDKSCKPPNSLLDVIFDETSGIEVSALMRLPDVIGSYPGRTLLANPRYRLERRL